MSDNVTYPLRALSWDRHKSWSWRRPADYGFAKQWQSVPVTVQEAVSAASCFPIVFSRDRNGILPQALLRRGPEGQSAFIGPEGQWRAAWLPPRLAAWPFDLIEDVAGGQALALHEDSNLASPEPGQYRIYTQAEGAPDTLAPEAARLAALLKDHAEARPATAHSAKALHDMGLLAAFEGKPSIMIVERQAAAALDEAAVVLLHRAGALGLLHAGLVSLAHLDWMERAERFLSSGPRPQPRLVFNRKNPPAGTGFLAALATDVSADEALIQFPGLTKQ